MTQNEKSLHYIIETEILPNVAERLKKEGLISSYDNERFIIPSFDKEVKSIEIRPDLVLHCPNDDKILVEVANPEDPKRFVGEIVYPAILKKDGQIRASLVFVIGDIKKHGRSLSQRHILSQMLGKYSSRFISYPSTKNSVYISLKDLITKTCK